MRLKACNKCNGYYEYDKYEGNCNLHALKEGGHDR